jgi:hypothetical protein
VTLPFCTSVIHPSNNCSIIGKLNFLAQNPQPAIAFAVHQCAGFVLNPNQTHQAAVKHLCHYILGTRDKGLILRPTFTTVSWLMLMLTLRAYATQTMLICTKPPFPALVLYSAPIIWTSKLQSEIALSTCEAEYIALAMCAHPLIPMRTLLKEKYPDFDHWQNTLPSPKLVWMRQPQCLANSTNPLSTRTTLAR